MSASGRFSKFAFKVPEKYLDCRGKERSSWIVLACFCCVQFINDSRYFSVHKAMEFERHTQPRESIVSFLQMSFCNSASELNDYCIIAIKALQKIYIKEELFLDFGSEYSFW